jgi:hypothetical protein
VPCSSLILALISWDTMPGGEVPSSCITSSTSP